MDEKKVFKIFIQLAVMTVIVVGIFQIWSIFRGKQEYSPEDVAEYQAASKNDEREISDTGEVYISDELQGFSDEEEVNINDDLQTISDGEEVYINSISAHRKKIKSRLEEDIDESVVYINEEIYEDEEQELIQEKEVYINEEHPTRL